MHELSRTLAGPVQGLDNSQAAVGHNSGYLTSMKDSVHEMIGTRWQREKLQSGPGSAAESSL